MMLKPSPRDRQLAQLRQAAAKKNIRVRILPAQAATGNRTLMIYSMPLPQSQRQGIHAPWSLIKQSFEHELHFAGRWDWMNPKQIAPEQQHDSIREQLADFPSDILGMELTDKNIGLYWTEQGLLLDEIEQLLTRCRDQLSKIH